MRVVAHRGAAARCPENTMAAIAAAVKHGADIVELDVHATADNALVVIHDYYVDRTTNGSGPVVDYHVADITKLDAGSWFDPLFANETIPVLRDVFNAFPAMHFELDLKGFTEAFVKQALDVCSAGIEHLSFSSDHPAVLNTLQKWQPHASVGFRVPPRPEWMEAEFWRRLALVNAELGNFARVSIPFALADETLVERGHARNLVVQVAECRTAEEICLARDMGADEISTTAVEMACHIRDSQ